MFNNPKKKSQSDAGSPTEDIKKEIKGSTYNLLNAINTKTPFKLESPRSNVSETKPEESDTEKETKNVHSDFAKKK